jgi:hypothetical protein
MQTDGDFRPCRGIARELAAEHEAAMLEDGTRKVLDRIREAKRAICDRIEELHHAWGLGENCTPSSVEGSSCA